MNDPLFRSTLFALDTIFPVHPDTSRHTGLKSALDARHTQTETLGRDETAGANSLAPAISHADGTAPRTGVNLIRLSTGRCVQCLVIYVCGGQYECTELDYDEGRPTCMSDSPLAALELLREALEVEMELEAQRRDAEFRAVLRRVNCEDCE